MLQVKNNCMCCKHVITNSYILQYPSFIQFGNNAMLQTGLEYLKNGHSAVLQDQNPQTAMNIRH